MQETNDSESVDSHSDPSELFGDKENLSVTDNDFKEETSHDPMLDAAMFRAYEILRKTALDYNLEHELAVPRIVFVGDTSAGKSMLVQMFLRFPCAFSQASVGTRCPVQYKLRYDPNMPDKRIRIIQPVNWQPEDLGKNLQNEMARIENESKQYGGFRLEPFVVEIASKQYTDIEILDVPGLVSGDRDPKKRAAVERITQHYVRDSSFMIIQLKEAQQLVDNTYGTRRIGELCTEEHAQSAAPQPPRNDYTQHTITIQTKFDTFMSQHGTGTDTNQDIQALVDAFPNTYFTNMVFDGYSFADNTYEKNVQYINQVPATEKKYVDEWIDRLNREARKPNSRHQFFNQQYRPLIGIDVVRDKIRELWLRAFRAALPNLKRVIDQLIEKQKQNFDSSLFDLEQQDPRFVRGNYLKYIEAFRTTISNYAAYRAEVNFLFPLEEYGRTYEEIENDYNEWNRKQPLTWRAYIPANLLKQHPNPKLERLATLDLQYVGARHFERLRQVFDYMVFSHDPLKRDRAWFESSQSLLYGGVSDYENIEKAVRESLFTFVRETFLIGICWLTQMYTFLTDHFARHVKLALLQTEFSYLDGHVKFLSLVDLEYHTVTRKFIRQAVEAIHQARYAKMAYATHNICGALKNLVHSIKRVNMTTDETESDTDDNSNNLGETFMRVASDTVAKCIAGQTPVAAFASSAVSKISSQNNPLKLIYGTGKFLTNSRNPQTADYLPQTRDTVLELYTAVRGQLLYDITTYFFANLVTKIQEYKSISFENALQNRINRMSDKEIARMANIEIEGSRQKVNKIHEQLKSLELARDAIDDATACINETNTRSVMDDNTDDEHHKKQRIRTTLERTRRKRLSDIERKMKMNQRPKHRRKRTAADGVDKQKQLIDSTHNAEVLSNDSNSDDDFNDEEPDAVEDELELMNYDDVTSSETYLLGVFRKHDREDLELGFLPGDSLKADVKFVEEKKKQQQDTTTTGMSMLSQLSGQNLFHLPSAALKSVANTFTQELEQSISVSDDDDDDNDDDQKSVIELNVSKKEDEDATLSTTERTLIRTTASESLTSEPIKVKSESLGTASTSGSSSTRRT